MAPIFYVYCAILLLCAAAAVWRGGRWERGTAAMLAVVLGATALTPFDGVNVPLTVVVMDGSVALVLLYGAAFGDRRWLLAAAAFQLLVLANHLAFVRFHEIQRWAYVTASYLWSFGVLLALAVGALTRKHGENPTVKLQDEKNARR